MERKEIDRIETLKTEDGKHIDKTSAIAGKKELPPLPPAAEKAKEPEKFPAEAAPKAEKSPSPSTIRLLAGNLLVSNHLVKRIK